MKELFNLKKLAQPAMQIGNYSAPTQQIPSMRGRPGTKNHKIVQPGNAGAIDEGSGFSFPDHMQNPATGPMQVSPGKLPLTSPMPGAATPTAPEAIATPPAPAQSPAPSAQNVPGQEMIDGEPVEKLNPKMLNLTQQANAAATNISNPLILAFKQAFNKEILEKAEMFQKLPATAKANPDYAWYTYIPEAVDNFFTKPDRTRMVKWLSFAVANAAVMFEDDEESIIGPGDDPKTSILRDIIEKKDRSPVYSSMFNFIARKDPELWQAIEINAKKLNKAGQQTSGISLNDSVGTDGGMQRGDLLADPKALRPDELLGSMQPEEREALFDVANVFLSKEENTTLLREIIQESKAENPQQILTNAVQEAFAGLVMGGDRARWMMFFTKNPKYLPASVQEVAKKGQNFIIGALEDANVKRECFNILKNLAASSNEDLQIFVEDQSEKSLEDQISNQHIDHRTDLRSLPKQIGKIGKDAYSALAFSLFQQKEEYARTRDPKLLNTIKNTATLFALVKNKSKAVSTSIEEQLNSPESKFEAGKGENKGKTFLRLKNSKDENGKPRPGGGRLVLETGGVEEPLKFSRVENLAMSKDWIPKAIDLMDKMSEDGTAPGCNQRSKTQPNEIFDKAYNEEYSSDKKTDHLSGWRKVLGEQLSKRLTPGLSPKDIAAVIYPSKTNAKGEANKNVQNIINLFEGKPANYNDALIKKLGSVLNVPEGDPSFFALPRTYDKYNSDDIANLGGQTNNAFNHYGKYLLKKQEEYQNRFGKKPYSPTSMMLYVGMMGTHSSVGQANPKGPFGSEPPKFLYRLIPRSVATDKGGEPHPMSGIKKNLGLNEEQQNSPNWQEHIPHATGLEPGKAPKGYRAVQVKDRAGNPVVDKDGKPKVRYLPDIQFKNNPDQKQNFKNLMSARLANFLKAIEAAHAINDMRVFNKHAEADAMLDYIYRKYS